MTVVFCVSITFLIKQKIWRKHLPSVQLPVLDQLFSSGTKSPRQSKITAFALRWHLSRPSSLGAFHSTQHVWNYWHKFWNALLVWVHLWQVSRMATSNKKRKARTTWLSNNFSLFLSTKLHTQNLNSKTVLLFWNHIGKITVAFMLLPLVCGFVSTDFVTHLLPAERSCNLCTLPAPQHC